MSQFEIVPCNELRKMLKDQRAQPQGSEGRRDSRGSKSYLIALIPWKTRSQITRRSRINEAISHDQFALHIFNLGLQPLPSPSVNLMFCNANSSEHWGQPLLEISNLRVDQLIRNLTHRSVENDLLRSWPIKNRNLDLAEGREIGEFQGRNIFWSFCRWWITRIYDNWV